MNILIIALILSILINTGFLFRGSRAALNSGFGKLVENFTSKRFITLAVGTYFVYAQIPIDSNWLILAGLYIGLDTMQNHGVFSALADKLRDKPASNLSQSKSEK